MQHFVDCVRLDQRPLVSGEDGKVVLEIIFAAYESAGAGRRIDFPYDPPAWAHSPIHCWKPWLSPDCPEELKGVNA